jgi:signal transduction histidine kinase/phage shock protein PspC (stress-responsive transcriptional regulator)
VWRSHDHRVIAGVAGGIGERLGVDAVHVRAAFVALSVAGGIGVFAYLLLWTLADQERQPTAVVVEPSPHRDVGMGLVVFGALLILRGAGFWLGDAVAWPVVLVVLGSSVIWSRGGTAEHDSWNRLATAATNAEALGRAALVRLGLGGVLVVSGVATVLVRSEGLALGGQQIETWSSTLIAVVITGLGVALILGPWMVRQAQQLTEERRERIRSQERAEVAAHLHDSVLQTLAMIQRSDSPRRMVGLARSQERELRAWLYGTDSQQAAERLQPMFEDVAARIEQRYDLPVELVVVGDTLVDDQMRALSAATYEALQNAARHSGAESVSVYVEVEPDHVTAFVRDEGTGFDGDAVLADRRGIRNSIVGRMQRHGGRATIRSEPGGGTEVELQLPREG